MFDSHTIPAWVVAVNMVLTGAMWLKKMLGKKGLQREEFLLLAHILAITFITQGFVYGVVYQLFTIDIEFRAFLSRVMMILICQAQFLPLAVASYRSMHNDDISR